MGEPWQSINDFWSVWCASSDRKHSYTWVLRFTTHVWPIRGCFGRFLLYADDGTCPLSSLKRMSRSNTPVSRNRSLSRAGRCGPLGKKRAWLLGEPLIVVFQLHDSPALVPLPKSFGPSKAERQNCLDLILLARIPHLHQAFPGYPTPPSFFSQ